MLKGISDLRDKVSGRLHLKKISPGMPDSRVKKMISFLQIVVAACDGYTSNLTDTLRWATSAVMNFKKNFS